MRLQQIDEREQGTRSDGCLLRQTAGRARRQQHPGGNLQPIAVGTEDRDGPVPTARQADDVEFAPVVRVKHVADDNLRTQGTVTADAFIPTCTAS